MPHNFLVSDHGAFFNQSLGLCKGGNKVKYYTSWPSAFPVYEEFAVGEGFQDEGLEKVLYFYDHFDWADCVANFDNHGNNEINFLRKHFPNKSIFGCGQGEKLENDRWGLKRIQKDLGLKVQHTVKCKGVGELRKYLKDNKDKFVKLNIWRESHESFYAKDYNAVELIIDELETSFGPHKEKYEFIVEDNIDSEVQSGFDGFFNGIDYVKPFFRGYEYHNNLYIARVVDEMSPQIKETMEALKPVLRKLDYRGSISTEEKIVSKTEHYLIDLTARLPSPLSALYPQYILNWPELVYKVGLKQNVKCDIVHKYVGAFSLTSDHAKQNWLKIDIKEEDRTNIKFIMACKNNGKYYSVQGMNNVVVLVAAGNTVDQVLELLKKYAQKVDAYMLYKDDINGIDKIKDIISDGRTVGIDV